MFIPTTEGKLEQGSNLSHAFHLCPRQVSCSPSSPSVSMTTARACARGPPQGWEISKEGSTELVKVEPPTGADHTSTPHDVTRHLHPKPEARGTLSLRLVNEEADAPRSQQPVQRYTSPDVQCGQSPVSVSACQPAPPCLCYHRGASVPLGQNLGILSLKSDRAQVLLS